MAKITRLDKKTLDTLHLAMVAALAKLSEETGLVFTAGSGTFDPKGAYATLQIKIATVGADGKPETREASDFKSAARLFGLEPSDLGRTFKAGGGNKVTVYTIVGLKPQSRQAIIAEAPDGRRYKFTPEAVKTALKQPPPAPGAE